MDSEFKGLCENSSIRREISNVLQGGDRFNPKTGTNFEPRKLKGLERLFISGFNPGLGWELVILVESSAK
jgi:hypothetical protein